MVLAISFLEAPLKFRAPGLELRVGLSIGRIVFRALNAVELRWAVVITAALVIQPVTILATVAVSIAVVLVSAQLGIVRPRLNLVRIEFWQATTSPDRQTTICTTNTTSFFGYRQSF